MEQVLLRVKTVENPKLQDEQFVEEIMERLMSDYPQIHGYFWERKDDHHINLLIYGDIEVFGA